MGCEVPESRQLLSSTALRGARERCWPRPERYCDAFRIIRFVVAPAVRRKWLEATTVTVTLHGYRAGTLAPLKRGPRTPRPDGSLSSHTRVTTAEAQSAAGRACV